MAHLTVDGDFPIARQFAQTRSQFIHGDVHGSGNIARRKLLGRSHVEEEGTLGGRRCHQRRHVGLGMVAPQQAGGDKARHVDRVFGRAVLRCVSQFHLFQVEDGHAGLDGHGQHVDAFVHAGPAHRLGAEDAARLRIEEQLERQRLRAGIVAGMVRGMDIDHPKGPLARRSVFSEAPVIAAVRPKTPTMAVPCVPR